MLRLALVLLCVLATLAAAAPKKKKKKGKAAKPEVTATVEAEVSRALDTAEQAVGGCVLERSGPGPWTRVVRVKVTINSAGQLMSNALSFEPQDDAADQMRPCVDDALKQVSYPKSAAPLVNAEREWTFRVEAQ